METPEKFKNLAESVRNEVYGKDVREAIATSIEKTGASSETAIKITEQLIDGSFDEAELTTEIERRLNELEEEYAPELNNVKSQLAQITYNVKSFGAKGDGVTDDTTAIQNALQALKETGGRLVFPPGTYIQGDGVKNVKATSFSISGEHTDGSDIYSPDDGVDYPYYVSSSSGKKVPIGDQNIGEDLRLHVEGLNNAEIIGWGAVVKAHQNNSCIRNNAGFIFVDCHNLTVKGLTYDGSIEERHPDYIDSGGYNFQHGFAISDDSTNITFEQVTAYRCVMDGFNVHRRLENIRMVDCFGTLNYRQGMTVGDARGILVDGGAYTHNGTIYGTAPMDGIDVEVWEETPTHDLIFKNIYFTGNLGLGLSLQKGSTGAVVENCTFDKNRLRIDQVTTRDNTIKNNRFINTRLVNFSGGTYIDDNEFIFDEVHGEIESTYELSIQYQDTSNKYKNGVSRKGRIKGNTIYVSPTIDGMDVLGGINMGDESADFIDNTIINAYSTIPTPVINGIALESSRNVLIYNGSLEDAGRARGGISTSRNKMDEVYNPDPNYPFDEDTSSTISSNIDTGEVTAFHRKSIISSRKSRASGGNSAVLASNNSRTTGDNSTIISSGSSETNDNYPNENEGQTSTIIASRATKNTENYVVVGGYRGGIGDANTQDRKWKLDSQSGDIVHAGTINSGHSFSDFAELFPNLTEVEQGMGLLQTLDGNGVRPANEGERVIGVTSGTAGIILGDTPYSWNGRWLKDEFGCYIYETVPDMGWEPKENETEEDRPYITIPKENPEYNPELSHLSRKERPDEWSIVGLVGQVYVRVTQEVQAMDYVKAYSDGVGSISEHATNLLVMKITTPYDESRGYAVAFCFLK